MFTPPTDYRHIMFGRNIHDATELEGRETSKVVLSMTKIMVIKTVMVIVLKLSGRTAVIRQGSRAHTHPFILRYAVASSLLPVWVAADNYSNGG